MFQTRFIAPASLLVLGILAGVAGSQWLMRGATRSPGMHILGEPITAASQSSRIAKAAEPAARDNGREAGNEIQPDWCAEHRVPESECTLCHPALVESFKAKGDWCNGHAVPESHCRICNPELKFGQEPALPTVDRADHVTDIAQDPKGDQAARIQQPDWCPEHRVPESECTRCKPALVESFKAKGDWCNEHGVPESHCRTCNPDLKFSQEPAPLRPQDFSLKSSVFFPPNRTGCATDGAIIRFASVQTAERAGLMVEPALAAQTSDVIEAPAELVLDETRTTAVTSTIPLTVVRWLVNPGQAVTADQVLAEVESPEMAQMQAGYSEELAEWTALDAERKRREELHQAHLISAGEFQSAVAAADAARARVNRERGLLLAAGLPSEALDTQADHSRISARFTLRAPTAGTLIERRGPLGELLAAGTPLAVLSDPQSLWIEARVREQDLRQVRSGCKMEFTTDGNALERIGGEVIWVAQFLDHATRTGLVRARLLDQGHQLRAHEFGRARIYTGDTGVSVVIPMDAVQWEGCCNVVFVQESVDQYRPRKVRIERGDVGHYRVANGLLAGELIVVRGSFLLKTELKKGSIGAGCCAVEPTS